MHLVSLFCSPFISRALSTVFERVAGRPFWVSGADVLNGRPLITNEAQP